MLVAYPDRHSMKRLMLEKAIEVLGLGWRSVEEFQSRNIRDFNLVCEDCEDVDYYSFSTKKHQLQVSELLRAGWDVITDYKFEVECDGMTEVNEQKWGRHLLTFDHDHFEVAGLNPKVTPQHVANLVTDNLRVNEIKREGGNFEPYGGL